MRTLMLFGLLALAGCGLKVKAGPLSASGAVLDLTQKSTGAKILTVDAHSDGLLSWLSEQLSGSGLGKFLHAPTDQAAK